jgi:pyruvate kinase
VTTDIAGLIDGCIDELEWLRTCMCDAAGTAGKVIEDVHPRHRLSARNLVHYRELRQHDIRDLQRRLARLGISSLSHAEQDVLGSVDAVLAVLRRLRGEQVDLPVVGSQGSDTLHGHALDLLGPPPSSRRTRIMVTLPTEAATDPALVEEMIAAGMDLARVNCAHDSPETWRAMVATVRGARPGVVVAMDLAGPKVRTVDVSAGVDVVKVKPERDRFGRVTAASRVRVSSVHPAGRSSSAEVEDAVPSVSGAGRSTMTSPVALPEVQVETQGWIRRRRVGEVVMVRDARDELRAAVVVDVDTGLSPCAAPSCILELDRTVYLTAGVRLSTDTSDDCTVVSVSPVDRYVVVHHGDRVTVYPAGSPAPTQVHGHLVSCTVEAVVRDGRVGDRVLFDDGKIAGTVESRCEEPPSLVVLIDRARAGGSKLRPGKGINLPDTDLGVAALTAQDLCNLQHVVELADAVSVSFLRDADDVVVLHEALDAALAAAGREDIGVVLKIETRAAFENLPVMLLTALRRPRVGVMIARGDLAVEVGFERLAEVQEEILWLCEAAHVPVIWATQVLESMAKTGQPSRGDVTDAARSHRAECVMLNKGPHMVSTIASLASIIERMHGHQHKKHHLLRRLEAWQAEAIGESSEEAHVALDEQVAEEVHEAGSSPTLQEIPL